MKLNFLNSDLKSKVDKLMDELWAGGVNNPMTAIEQISYLMFLKSITEMDEKQQQLAQLSGNKREPIFNEKTSKYGWRVIARLAGDELFNTVTEAFENLQNLPGLSAMGKTLFKQAHLKIYNKPTLRSVISMIDAMDYNNTERYDTDVKGDLYEYLLSRISASGTNGQFRTPRHIIQAMVDVLDPKPSDTILDPACGTAGFLIEAYKHVMHANTSEDDLKAGHVSGDKLTPAQHKFLHTEAINGYDNDSDMIKVALMNLYLHNLNSSHVINFDPICLPEEKKKKYDCILANPPFSGTVNQENIQEDINLNTTKTELLFLKYMYDHLVIGGRCGVIVPEGVLFGSSSAHKKMRQIFMDECHIDAIVSLPSGVFKPYAGVKTAIIFYTKGGQTDKVWFYEVVGDGYTLDDRRSPDPDNNNLIDLAMACKEKKEGIHSWYASRDDILKDNYNLSANVYKKIDINNTIYDSSKNLINEALELERGIVDELEKIMSQL